MFNNAVGAGLVKPWVTKVWTRQKVGTGRVRGSAALLRRRRKTTANPSLVAELLPLGLIATSRARIALPESQASDVAVIPSLEDAHPRQSNTTG